MNSNDMILILGVSMMCLGLLFGICSAVILKITGKRIRERLNSEYGPERHT